MSVEDVGTFLHAIQLQHCAPNFARHGIDGKVLLKVVETKGALDDLGLKPLEQAVLVAKVDSIKSIVFVHDVAIEPDTFGAVSWFAHESLCLSDWADHVEAFKRAAHVNDFKNLTKLAEGAGGAVFSASLESVKGKSVSFAVKRCGLRCADKTTMGQNERKFGQDSKSIRSRCVTLADHDNIVKYFGEVKDGEDKYNPIDTALVFELCEGDLCKLVQQRIDDKCAFFKEEEVMLVASDILCALHDLHMAGFVHRDVCLNNVLFVHRDGKIRLKLADFGLARRIEADSAYERPLTILKTGFVDTAPEVRPKDADVDAAQAHLLDAW